MKVSRFGARDSTSAGVSKTPASNGPEPDETLEVLRAIKAELVEHRRYLEVLRLAATSEVVNDVQRFADERRMDYFETLDYIYEHKVSFARYGDGEMRLMFRDEYNLGFQRNSVALRRALKALFLDHKYRDKVLLSFPYVWRGVYWSGVWTDLWPEYHELAKHVPRYGITQVTRPLFFQNAKDEGVQAWRRMWDGKRVCIITGKNSRFEMIPELFDNIADVHFVHSLPKHAFDDIPRVLEEVRTSPQADLYLLSLGPAGTILAAELGVEDRWALDIGHISDSYHSGIKGAEYPERKAFTR